MHVHANNYVHAEISKLAHNPFTSHAPIDRDQQTVEKTQNAFHIIGVHWKTEIVLLRSLAEKTWRRVVRTLSGQTCWAKSLHSRRRPARPRTARGPLCPYLKSPRQKIRPGGRKNLDAFTLGPDKRLIATCV